MANPAEMGASPESSARADADERQQRGTRQLLIARLCFYGCSYVASAVLARKLGAASYGVYGVIVSQLLWLEIVVSAGIRGATAKLIADGHHDAGQVERSARALLMGLAILFFGLCWLLAPHVAGLMRILDGAALFRVAALDAPLIAMYASYEGILYGHRRFGALAVAVAALGLLRVAGTLALIRFGITVERVLVVIVVSTLMVNVGLLVTYWFRTFEPAFRSSTIVRVLAAGICHRGRERRFRNGRGSGPDQVVVMSGVYLLVLSRLKAHLAGSRTWGEPVTAGSLSHT